MSQTNTLSRSDTMSLTNGKFKIMGINGVYFSVFTLITIIAAYMGKLSGGLIGTFALLIALGGIIQFIGNKTPILKDYLGGGASLALFGMSVINYFGLIPEGVFNDVKTFVLGGGFLNFYIAALICGSILGMNRSLLIKSFAKYIPVILGGVIVSLLLTGVVGQIIGYGFADAMFFIALPIMGGGVGAGAIPLSEIFGASLGRDSAEILTICMPALMLGNAVAIISAGLLDRIGKAKPELTGNGKLVAIGKEQDMEESKFVMPTYV